MTTNADFPRAGRCLIFRASQPGFYAHGKARDCHGCRTIQWCPFYDKGKTMIWLNLISLILQLAEAELPAVEGLIAGIKAVSAALATPAPTFPGSADATSFPVKP
jgi:hypothetical protein